MKQNFMFTSESVTEGHPDKLCDQIADSIIDRFLQVDPYSRAVAECAVAKGILFIAARFASQVRVDIPETARQVISQVGYTREDFNAKSCTVMTSFTELPEGEYRQMDERELDDSALESIAARNVANAFGYACSQTAAMAPMPIWLAHKLARRMASVRLQRLIPYLAPDGKTQVAVEFRDRRPARLHSITLIASHIEPIPLEDAKFSRELYELVVEPSFVGEDLRPDSKTLFFVNPEGPFLAGGPSMHSGMTGRKTAIDTYGEYSRNSEAALSGKDPTRIDRVGTYAARHAAKNVVSAGLAQECEVQLTYSIGLARPVSIQVETFGTGVIPDDRIADLIRRHFDFRPAAIIARFNLRYLPLQMKGGFYRRLAAYGHVGRMDIGLPWELPDKAVILREDAGIRIK
jgi:S-adenosylmethionine synthetase